MTGIQVPEHQSAWRGGRVLDVLVTLVCWSYFILGFLFCFSFFYGAAYLVAARREYAFQYLNYLFFTGFLGLLRLLSPRQQWAIDQDIRQIKSSIIVCNHLSYLDPLLFISLFSRQKTIVKTRFFQFPVFGWLLKQSGYVPATMDGKNGLRMIEQVGNMGEFLHSGGNLFVFPEGTRNRDGKLGPLHPGVFKIARLQRCPIYVLSLSNTDKLFTPGQFLFNTRQTNSISMKVLARLEPVTEQGLVSVAALHRQVRQYFLEPAAAVDQPIESAMPGRRP